MNLVLHIFRKDTRHLYPEILLTLACTVAFAWAAPVQWFSIGGTLGGSFLALLAPLLRILLPIAWLVLISRLIHDESLVGDRQFWISRPYTWPTLLASKLLFLAVFLSLPFLLMQIYLLHHAGLNVSAALPDLLRYHLRLTAMFFLPFVAVATVTANFARFAISTLAVLLYLIGTLALGTHLVDRRMMPPHLETFCGILFCAVLTAVVIVQYATRRTRPARLCLLALPVVLLLAVLLAPAKSLVEHSYPVLPAAFRPSLSLDPNPDRQQPGSGQPLLVENFVMLSLPLQQTGIQPGFRYKAQGIAVTIDTPEGFNWSSPFVLNGTDLYATGDKPVIAFTIPASVYDRIRNAPVDLHLQIAAWVYRTDAPQTIDVSAPSFAAPSQGLCPLSPEGFTSSCRYAFRLPAPIDISAEVSDQMCGLDRDPSVSAKIPGHLVARHFIGADDPEYLAFDFDPITTTPLQLSLPHSTPEHFLPAFLCPGAPVTFTPHQLVSHSQIQFDARGLLLSPYVKRQASVRSHTEAPR